MPKNLLAIVLAVAAVALGYFVFAKSAESPTQKLFGNNVHWEFRDGQWLATGTPPACPEPLHFPAPVDVSAASGRLYPGQIRGTDYKPHGSFRFDDQSTNEVNVRAVMDGRVIKASRYLVDDQLQHSLFVINDCGIMVLYGHVLVPSPRLQEMYNEIPIGEEGNSRTTQIQDVYLQQGDLIATEVGLANNTFFDFGVYDLRQTNGIDYSENDRARYSNINEYGRYAVCWFDYLTEPDATLVNALPLGGIEGAVSDYCQ